MAKAQVGDTRVNRDGSVSQLQVGLLGFKVWVVVQAAPPRKPIIHPYPNGPKKP